VSLTAGQKVLVTLYTSCENTNNKGCYMSFNATGAVTHTASDNNMVGGPATVAGRPQGAGGSFLLTATSTATATFKAEYRVDASIGIFRTSTIIVQVFQ
jgi:hypothetical protein